MRILTITSSTYSVIEHEKNRYRLVKIIGEYKDQTDAYRDVHNILSGKKSESDIEHKYVERKFHHYMTDVEDE